MNTIRLLRGECRATNEELKKFQKGGTIWGNDENPVAEIGGGFYAQWVDC